MVFIRATGQFVDVDIIPALNYYFVIRIASAL